MHELRMCGTDPKQKSKGFENEPTEQTTAEVTDWPLVGKQAELVQVSSSLI